MIDADGYDSFADGVRSGLCNRVKCPYCGSEFTIENPILIYSWQYKMYVTAAFYEDFYPVNDFANALRIAGAEDITLRKTDYAVEATEKIHIVNYGLCDIKTEFFKVFKFPDYINMRNDEETIIFDRIENDNLIFSHRHFTDEIINTSAIPVSEYESFECEIPHVPKGKWFKIDKNWVLKHLEDK